MNREKKLVKNSAIFAIGNIGSKLINFIMLPYYTYLLTTSQYGEIDLITSSASFLVPILSLNLIEGVFRFSLDKNYEQKKVFSTGVIVASLLSILFMIIIIFVDTSNLKIYFYTCLLIVVSIIQNISKQFVRAINELKVFVYSDFVQVISFIVLNIIFIGYFRFGVIGYILAKIIALILDMLIIIILGKVYRYFNFKMFDIKYIKKMLVYSLPLIPNSLMWWAMNLSDRYVINIYLGLAANGLYSVACKFPTILSQINAIFFNAWQMSAIEEYDSQDVGIFYSKIFNVFSIVMLLATSGLLVGIKVIMKVLVSNSFYEAWKYVPFLFLGAVFSALAGFLGTNYVASKNTRGAFKTSIIGAIVNIVLNFVFIPYIGIQGACLATMISFMTLFIIRMKDVNKFIKITYNIKNLCFLILGIGIQIFILFKVKSILLGFLISFIIFFINCSFNFKTIKIAAEKLLKKS